MDIAIIGSGIIGLASALALTEAGFNVVVIARDLPGHDTQDWASPWAGVAILPYPDAAGHDLQEKSFKFYWELAHKDQASGTQVVKTTEYYDDRENDSTVWYKHFVPYYRRIPDKDLPKNAKLGFHYKTTTVNPEKLLPWLKKKLETRGVRFVQQTVKRIEDVKNATGCKIIINASGLGAYDLASDNAVVPARGQTMFVKSDFNELKIWQGSHYTYVIPRMGTGGVIIGGVSQEGNFDRKVDQDLRPDILNRVKVLAGGSLDNIDLERDVQRDIVAFRPGRRGGYRLEAEGDVIHAYGFGSLGYVYSYGVGLKVKDLVHSVAGKKSPASRL